MAAWITVPIRFKRPVALVPVQLPDGVPLPPGAPLLAFSPVLRANPEGCTDAMAPEMLWQQVPDFSRVADRLGMEARAEMTTKAWLQVDTTGGVKEVVVMQTEAPRSVRERFENAVMAAFRQWRYAPATCNGEPAAADVTILAPSLLLARRHRCARRW